jgi:serine/threonine protein kinase
MSDTMTSTYNSTTANTTLTMAENNNYNSRQHSYKCADASMIRYEYDSSSELGRGSYGIVRRARDKLTGKHVAIKHMVSDFKDPNLMLVLLRELTILRITSQSNILRMSDAFVPAKSQDVCMVLDLLKGTLSQRIYCMDIIPVTETKRLARDLVRGVAYLHANDIVHLDIKTTNIGFGNDDVLQLFDFSNSIHERYAHKNGTDPCVTLWYRAPELCRYGTTGHWKAVDMWSVGCVLAEMLLGRYVFGGWFNCGTEQTSQNIQQYDEICTVLKTLESNLRVRCKDENVIQLIMSLLVEDPTIRLTASQMLAHPALCDDCRDGSGEEENEMIAVIENCEKAFEFETRDTDATYLELCIRREMSWWTSSPCYATSKRRRV